MKSLLKFLGVLVVLFVWIELVDLSFLLKNYLPYVIYVGDNRRVNEVNVN